VLATVHAPKAPTETAVVGNENETVQATVAAAPINPVSPIVMRVLARMNRETIQVLGPFKSNCTCPEEIWPPDSNQVPGGAMSNAV
jgi:hypothetical protein